MALGFASATAASILDGFGNATAYTGASNIWVKLHTASPGTGSTAAATETTRKEVTFAAASGGSLASDAALTWTSVAGSETYTHFSLWTASTAGTFLGSGSITANAVTAGDTFTIASGSFTVSLNVAS